MYIFFSYIHQISFVSFFGGEMLLRLGIRGLKNVGEGLAQSQQFQTPNP